MEYTSLKSNGSYEYKIEFINGLILETKNMTIIQKLIKDEIKFQDIETRKDIKIIKYPKNYFKKTK